MPLAHDWRMRKLRRWLPTREALRRNPALRWLGPLLDRPWLWRLSRRGVAAGAAIGVFFGFLIPVLQIAFAALFAVAFRANLPVAAVATLVSNPLTYAPIFVAAYRVGAALLGEPAYEAEAQDAGRAAEMLGPGWWQRFAGIARPLMLGLSVFAVAGSASAYALALLAWRVAVLIRARRRRAHLRP